MTNIKYFISVKENDLYVQAPKLKIGDGVHFVEELPFESNTSISYIEEQ